MIVFERVLFLLLFLFFLVVLFCPQLINSIKDLYGKISAKTLGSLVLFSYPGEMMSVDLSSSWTKPSSLQKTNDQIRVAQEKHDADHRENKLSCLSLVSPNWANFFLKKPSLQLSSGILSTILVFSVVYRKSIYIQIHMCTACYDKCPWCSALTKT